MPNINGQYGYTIQGFMHGQGFDSHKYLRILPGGLQLELNLADAVLELDPNSIPVPNSDPGRSRVPGEMPLFTGFYSAHYPVLKTPPTKEQEPNTNPAGPFYTPTVGYYPFSEIGFMTLGEREQEALHSGGLYGTVAGWRRLNIAGYPGLGSTFTGRYKFDPAPAVGGPGIVHPAPGAVGNTGFITTQRDGTPQNVWDYTFVQISDDELFLTANGFMPRPGIGTGTMKKIH
jgi:hypothetical protein